MDDCQPTMWLSGRAQDSKKKGPWSNSHHGPDVVSIEKTFDNFLTSPMCERQDHDGIMYVICTEPLTNNSASNSLQGVERHWLDTGSSELRGNCVK